MRYNFQSGTHFSKRYNTLTPPHGYFSPRVWPIVVVVVVEVVVIEVQPGSLKVIKLLDY